MHQMARQKNTNKNIGIEGHDKSNYYANKKYIKDVECVLMCTNYHSSGPAGWGIGHYTFY